MRVQLSLCNLSTVVTDSLLEKNVRLLVCGGRKFLDVLQLWRGMDNIHLKYRIEVVIHGAASGADTLAGIWASKNSIAEESYPAEWNKNGRRAGFIRNYNMLNLSNPDLILHAPGGPGTANMLKLAKGFAVKTISLSEAIDMVP